MSPHQSPVSEQAATQEQPSSVPHTNSNLSSGQQQNEPPISSRHRNSNASSGDPTSPTSPAFSLASSSSAADTSSGGNRGRRKAAGSTHREPRSSTGELPAVHQTTSTAATSAVPSSLKSRASCLTQHNYLELNGSAGSVSGCDCSDDEVITKFHKAYSKATTPTSPEVKMHLNDGLNDTEPSGSVPKTAKESIDSGSYASSFEELGATGGAIGTTVAPSTDTDTSWQFVNKTTLTDSPPPQPTPPSTSGTDMTVAPFNGQQSLAGRSQLNLSNSTFHPQHSNESVSLLYAAQRLTRRRSDTAVYESSSGLNSRRRYNRPDYYRGDDDDDEYDDEDNGGGQRADMSRKRTKTSCDKCGKSKGNLRRHVAKFKRQLETTNATEVEIKLQLDAFLVYLETCNKNSMDLSDSEGAGGSVEGDSRDDVTLTNNQNFVDDNDIGIDDDVDDYDDDHFIFGDDEGIHVYGTDDTSGGSSGQPRQFINLTDYPDRY